MPVSTESLKVEFKGNKLRSPRSTSKESSAITLERLDLKLKKDQKDLIKKAADITKTSMSAIVLDAALKFAMKIVMKDRVSILIKEDSEAFIEAITNPPEPNQYLKDSFKEYREVIGN